MTMPIPKTIKLGKYQYTVTQPIEMMKSATMGNIDYELFNINVAKRCNVTSRMYTPKERSETFWHEVTHGILFDMGHHLANNEKFVTAFSKRLNNAIHSAKF